MSSIRDRVVDLAGAPLETFHRAMGFAVLGLSLVLAVANRMLSEHPFSEYWVVVVLGGLTGVLYVS